MALEGLSLAQHRSAAALLVWVEASLPTQLCRRWHQCPSHEGLLMSPAVALLPDAIIRQESAWRLPRLV